MVRITAEYLRAGSITAERIAVGKFTGSSDPAKMFETMSRAVPLSEFQEMHGLEPTGVMDERTKEFIEELEYKRANTDAQAKFIMDTAGMKRTPRRVKCTAAAHGRDPQGRTYHQVCDKTDHPPRVAHGVDLNGTRVRWGGGNGDTRLDVYVRLDGHGNYSHVSAREFDSTVVRMPSFSQGGYQPPVTRPKEFVQMQDPYLGGNEIPAKHPVPDVSKVMVREGSRARKSHPPMTREEYRTRFSEMEYTVIKCVRFGFRVIVTLARGGQWQYRRPTRAWAERTGTKRLRRELAKLDVIYNTDNPQGVRAKDLGIHFQMTPEELTEELAKRELEDRKKLAADWDAEFHRDEKAS